MFRRLSEPVQKALLSVPAQFLYSLAVIAIAFSFYMLTASPVGDCHWDGRFYCQMFDGIAVKEPFRRRIFPVFLAKLFNPHDALNGFFYVDVLAMVIVTLGLTFILARLISNRLVSISLSTCLVMAYGFARYTIHEFVNVPVLTDHIGLAMAVLFFVGVLVNLTAKNPVQFWGAAALIAGAVAAGSLSREVFAPGFTVALLTLALNKKNRVFYLVLAGIAAVITLLILTSSTAGVSILHVYYSWGRRFIRTPFGILKYFNMLLLAVWAWPIFAGINLKKVRENAFSFVVLAFSVVVFALSAIGGSNIDRIITPVGITLALFVATRSDSLARSKAFAIACFGWLVGQSALLIGGQGDTTYNELFNSWYIKSPLALWNTDLQGLLLSILFAVMAFRAYRKAQDN